MTFLCLFVQLPDRTSILSKGVFIVRIIGRSLLLNHSPSEWFSLYKKAVLLKKHGFSFSSVQSSSTKVPATTKVSPTAARGESFSPNTRRENTTVTRMLSLSMGTTTLAGPCCKAR